MISGALLASSFSAMAGEDYSQWLNDFFQDVQEYRQSQNPVWAAREGDENAKGKLRDVSPEAYAKRKDTLLKLIDELEDIKRENLLEEEQISYDMMMTQLKQEVAEVDFKTYEMPLTAEYGFHAQTTNLSNAFRFRTAEDYKDYIALLGAIPTFFEQNVANMRAGMERGFTVPRAVLDGYSDSIKVYIKEDPTETVWYRPFKSLPESINAEDKEALQQEAAEVIASSVVPQYQAYLTFFEQEYLPAAKKTIAAYDYPNGKAFYQNQIKHYTTLDLTPDEIHEICLKEVARIRKEMEEVIKTTGFEGSFDDFLHFLRTDEQFYAKTPEELLKEAAYMSKKMDHQLPKFFGKLPRQPYGVVPVPAEIAPKYTTGRYSGAPIDSDRAGEYWVNTYALEKRPLYNLEALTLHEAVPGHHLQTALAQELTDLPKFRQNTYISAFGEGWGLYSEKLGL